MTAASIYQDLRGHLAYLGLTATAEALPAHLDDAAKGRADPHRVPRTAPRGGSRCHPQPPTAGWRRQQVARRLGASIIEGRERVVRRFAAFTRGWPWRRRKDEPEAWVTQAVGRNRRCGPTRARSAAFWRVCATSATAGSPSVAGRGFAAADLPRGQQRLRLSRNYEGRRGVGR